MSGRTSELLLRTPALNQVIVRTGAVKLEPSDLLAASSAAASLLSNAAGATRLAAADPGCRLSDRLLELRAGPAHGRRAREPHLLKQRAPGQAMERLTWVPADGWQEALLLRRQSQGDSKKMKPAALALVLASARTRPRYHRLGVVGLRTCGRRSVQESLRNCHVLCV